MTHSSIAKAVDDLPTFLVESLIFSNKQIVERISCLCRKMGQLLEAISHTNDLDGIDESGRSSLTTGLVVSLNIDHAAVYATRFQGCEMTKVSLVLSGTVWTSSDATLRLVADNKIAG